MDLYLPVHVGEAVEKQIPSMTAYESQHMRAIQLSCSTGLDNKKKIEFKIVNIFSPISFNIILWVLKRTVPI